MAIFRGNVLLQVLEKLDQSLTKSFGVSKTKTCANCQENESGFRSQRRNLPLENQGHSQVQQMTLWKGFREIKW